MPTENGAETIGERLQRLRAELVTTRAVIERSQANGADYALGGASVTEIAIERAEARERRLIRDIRSLEARLAGTPARPGLAHTQTTMPE
jgi:hypothetical protein